MLPDVRNPGVVNIDLSLVKNIQIREKSRLQIRAESFNAFNHVNLGFANGGFSPGANGQKRKQHLWNDLFRSRPA